MALQRTGSPRFLPLSLSGQPTRERVWDSLWKFGLIGSETVTLFRFRPPDQVHHRQASPNERSACSAPAPNGYPNVSVLENDWNYWNDWNVWNRLLSWNGWNHWNRLLLRCVQSHGGPQSAGQTENSFRQSQTILQDLKHPSFHFSIRRFERLERSAAVERLNGPNECEQ
jgi:hypothetical protein